MSIIATAAVPEMHVVKSHPQLARGSPSIISTVTGRGAAPILVP
jgi:hypothetical protein